MDRIEEKETARSPRRQKKEASVLDILYVGYRIWRMSVAIERTRPEGRLCSTKLNGMVEMRRKTLADIRMDWCVIEYPRSRHAQSIADGNRERIRAKSGSQKRRVWILRCRV